jgi:hypothetical protein
MANSQKSPKMEKWREKRGENREKVETPIEI